MIRVYNLASDLLAEIPVSLLPGEHRPLNNLLGNNGITLDDGRVEVEVTSATGKISAFASRLDNRSSDPLLISPVLKSSVSATRYVIPGAAYTNTGSAWRTDVRLFNAATAPVTATVTYFPTGNAAAGRSTTIDLNGGEIKALDNILNSLYGITEPAAQGSLLITTSSPSSIIADSRTYALTDNGTYGQFVPAVTPADSVGVGDRTLHVLQLEHSERFRTNVGLVETAGKDVVAEVSLIIPGSKATPKVPVSLPANTFVQFSLASFGLPDAIYNARITVKVISGAGKVSGFASVIDNLTADPTYVPGQ